MSRKKSKKGSREKAFSYQRGYPLIPPNRTHSNKKGPYNRRKEIEKFLENVKEETNHEHI